MIVNDKGKQLTVLVVKTPQGFKRVNAIYHIVNGVARIAWQAVRSCFGSGMWLNDKSWINDEVWMNNHF